MDFTISRTSGGSIEDLTMNYETVVLHEKYPNWKTKIYHITINTLEELLSLCDKTKESLIIDKNSDGNFSISIYDSWIE